MPVQLQDELRAFVRARGSSDFSVVEAFDGGRARCYAISTEPGRESFVVKRAHSAESLADEVALLEGATTQERTVPAVYAVLECGRAYVMEDLGRETVWQAAGARGGLPARLASDLLVALSRYAAATGRPFGDFHPGNAVLTNSGGVRLFDPGPTESSGDVTRDLGHWTCSTAASVVEGLVPNPWRYGRLLRLNVEMVALAASPLPWRERRPFVDEVFSRAHTELGTLRSSRWPRDRVTFWPALAAWAAMRWAARRRAGQGIARLPSR